MTLLGDSKVYCSVDEEDTRWFYSLSKAHRIFDPEDLDRFQRRFRTDVDDIPMNFTIGVRSSSRINSE